jgi:hypothetical protein
MLSVIAAVGQAGVRACWSGNARGLPRPNGKAATGAVCRQREGRLSRYPRGAGVTPSEIAVRLGIGRASVYRVLGEQSGGDRVAA